MAERRTRPARVLLVEDDPVDARLTLESIRQSKLHNEVTVVGNGEQALAHLRGEGEHAGRRRPDLVLLDINLPGMNGIEVLERIKADPAIATVPVVMLTTSDEDQDILRSYQLHAAAYVRKPLGLEEFAKMVDSIERFWFEVVLLPPDATG